MKNFLSVALIFFVLILIGCGSNAKNDSVDKDTEIDSVLLKGSFWVDNFENMPYLVDALARNDIEYLEQLMLERKVFQVDRDTKVVRFGVSTDEHYALIFFKEGRYTNKSGYVLKVAVYNVEEYRNYLEEKRKEALHKEEENKRHEQERQAQIEKERLEKIAQEQAKRDAIKQEALTLIQNCLMNSENYFIAITNNNENELNQLATILSEDEKKMMIAQSRLEPDVRECMESAREIIKNRGVAVLVYLRFRTKEGEVAKYHQKAEQLRQEFRNKYGY